MRSPHAWRSCGALPFVPNNPVTVWAPVYSKAIASSINLDEPVSSTVIVLCITIHIGVVARLLLHGAISSWPIQFSTPGYITSLHGTIITEIVVLAVIFNPSGFHLAVRIKEVPTALWINPTSLFFSIGTKIVPSSMNIKPFICWCTIRKIVKIFTIFFYPTCLNFMVRANVYSQARKMYRSCWLWTVICREDSFGRNESSQYSVWTCPTFYTIWKSNPFIFC